MANSPFIKPEPNDFSNFDPTQYMQYHQGNHNQQQFNGQGNMNINPASLSQSFGQSHMPGFSIPNGGFSDDELAELDDLNGQSNQQNGVNDWSQPLQNWGQGAQMNQQSTGIYSHTPNGAPMPSPFTQQSGYNFGFRSLDGQPQPGSHSMPQQASMARPQMQHVGRTISESHSGKTATPAMQLQIGEDFNSYPGMQAIPHQRQRSMGNSGYGSTPDQHSLNDGSPFPSPSNGHLMHPQISEVLRSGTHHHGKAAHSLPTDPSKMQSTGYQSQEAKRRRRRESHNLVERRRRDNINERIQDLGMLVPQHRLEDEKVRKHIQTNAPLSPSITNAPSMSPPNASLLASPQGRRSTGAGNITQGLPIEEKDKGPNKGDILNGSVAWTRDLMWYLREKLQQEQKLKSKFQEWGQAWPFDESDNEKRMQSEIYEILNKHANSADIASYSRYSGSGLRVPAFTNVAGDALDANGNVIGGASNGQQAVSPFQSGGSDLSSGGAMSQQGQAGGDMWNQGFKEEDEWNMEMQ